MNPFGARGRADALSLALDGGSVGSFAPYAAVADRLRTAGAAVAPLTAPSPDFRLALRTRLLAVAAVSAHQPATQSASRPLGAALSWPQGRRTQRGLAVAAGAMASVVAVSGIAVAGSQSLPGDPFYGVKRSTEALELRFAGSQVDRGSKHLEFAQERLREVRGLTLGRDAALGPAVPGTPTALGGSLDARVRETLAAMDAETRSGQALLQAASRDGSNQVPLRILEGFASAQGAGLRDLLAEVPNAVRPRVEHSLLLVTSVGVTTSQLLAVGVCTRECDPTAAAPTLPQGGPDGQPAPTGGPCGCEGVADPVPAGTAATSPTPAGAATSAEPSPQASPTASAPPPSPTATSAPTSTVPTPTPLPLPLPTLTPLVPGGLVPVPLG